MLFNLKELDHHFGPGYCFQEQFLNRLAADKFDSARARGRWVRAWRQLTRRPVTLKFLKPGNTQNSATLIDHGQEITAVPIRQIRGSEIPCGDFDLDFNPMHAGVKGGWLRIAAAVLNGQAPSPVKLIRCGDAYFVREGHCRISVARALGQMDIDAYVGAPADVPACTAGLKPEAGRSIESAWVPCCGEMTEEFA